MGDAGSPAAAWPTPMSVGGGVVRVEVAVTPNAKKTCADGLHDGALRVRLAAPPVDGKANEALRHWLAGELGLPRRAVVLRRGEASRRKQLEIDAAPEDVARWLRDALGRAA